MASIILYDEQFSALAKRLRLPSKQIEVKQFANKEFYVKVPNVKGKNVYVLKSFLDPNADYMQLFFINNALKHAKAKKIINVLPYIPYLRQEKIYSPGESISSEVLAKLTRESGADQVITIDIHQKINQRQYWNLKNIPGTKLFAPSFKGMKDACVVSPDLGGIRRAKELAKRLELPVVILKKSKGKHKHETLIFKGRLRSSAIIYDDMIDTGKTIIAAVEFLKSNSIKRIYVCGTHAILSGDALSRLKKTGIKLFVSDSIPKKLSGVKAISVADLLSSMVY